MSQRSWSKVDLINAVAASSCIKDVLYQLNLKENGDSYARMKRWIKEYNIDTSHFSKWLKVRPSLRTWSKEELESAVSRANSFRETLMLLGLRPASGNYVTIQRAIEVWKLDIKHFGTKENSKKGKPLSEYLKEGTSITSAVLHKRLVKEQLLQDICIKCGQDTEWQGAKLRLHLDHKNGNSSDNRLENLRILCPNCHSQMLTSTSHRKVRSYRNS